MSDASSDLLSDPVEQRLVDRARRELAAGSSGDEALRMRLRNRAEKYRELARRARFGGGADPDGVAAERQVLFDSLYRQLLERRDDQSAV